MDSGHHVFADRFYTGLDLVKFLGEKEMYYTGTVNVNRSGLPNAVRRNLKLKHLELKYWRDEDGTGPNLVVAWRDKKASKPVVAISSFHDNTTVEKNRRFGNAVRMPTVISDYNNSMNGCDRADQSISYYCSFDRKSYKWWKKLFWWLVEVTQYNAFVLYTLSQGPDGKKMSFLQFKESIVTTITKVEVQVNADPIAAKRRRPGRPADVPVPVRLGDTRHLVDAVESDRDCKVCSSRAGAGRKRTIYVCTNCPDEPHLCAKSCFLKYHTQPDYKIE